MEGLRVAILVLSLGIGTAACQMDNPAFDAARASESSTDSETETGPPLDPECTAPSGDFMQPCSQQTECPPDDVCLLVNEGPSDTNPGYCSPVCDGNAQCKWGSDNQCSDINIECRPAAGAQMINVCVLSCASQADCYPTQACSLTLGVCYPLP